MVCHLCLEEFEPNPEQVRAWRESGRSFEPTDWQCGDCRVDEREVLELWLDAGLLDEACPEQSDRDDLVDIDDFIT